MDDNSGLVATTGEVFAGRWFGLHHFGLVCGLGEKSEDDHGANGHAREHAVSVAIGF